MFNNFQIRTGILKISNPIRKVNAAIFKKSGNNKVGTISFEASIVSNEKNKPSSTENNPQPITNAVMGLVTSGQ